MANRETLRGLEALRAAAALCVVVYHALLVGGAAGLVSRWPNLSAGVDLFFVISGVVMARSLATRPAAGRFAWARARRIVPLYWLLTGAKLSVTLAAPGATPHTVPTAWNAVASLLFIPARDRAGTVRPVLPVGWTLDFEMFFYALLAASLAFDGGRVVGRVLPGLAVLTIAGFFRAPSWPAPLALANGLVAEFGWGLLLGSISLGAFGRVPVWSAAVLLAAGWAALLTLPLAGPWRCLAWGMPAAAIVAAALALENRLGARVPGPVLAVGGASYALYLVHPLVLPAVAAVAAPLGLGVMLALGVPLSILAAFFADRWVDRPIQNALRGGSRLVLHRTTP